MLDVIELFKRLVACSSESGHEWAIYDLLAEELTTLGFQVSPCAVRGSALPVPNLYAYLEGTGEPQLYVAHMDTVAHHSPIIPVVEDGVIHSGGEQILGADDKSGIAAILSAASALVGAKARHAPVELLFTVCEETGLLGSRNADFSMIRSNRGYVFDSSAGFGSILVRSPHILQRKVELFGKAAHAAIHPDQGVHALLAATQILQSLEWGQINADSTANVANLHAEGATNVICAYAAFEAEVRSFRLTEAERLTERIRITAERVCASRGATLRITELNAVPGFSLEEDAPVLQPICDACRKNGVEFALTSTSGASDANILNQNGIAAVNISTGMRDSHSPSESIRIDELERLTQIIKTMMAKG